jgi:hypothetical protein
MIKLGADPNSPAFSERPLEVGKDKFVRSVLQNLNDAAYQANVVIRLTASLAFLEKHLSIKLSLQTWLAKIKL